VHDYQRSLVWIVLGFAIAWAKAQHGVMAVWTSAKFEMMKTHVVIAIKPERLQHICNDVCVLTKINVICAKRLRALAGRAVHVASIIVFWIPFVSRLWAPLKIAGRSDAPTGCIWLKQIKHPLLWILAFLRQQKGNVCRTYMSESYLENDVEIQIVTDASSWRLGAVLVVHGNAQAYVAVLLTTDDEEQLSVLIGEAASQ